MRFLQVDNKNNRKTQHKPSRDERRSKDIQELKAENRTLRKQVARLRKELQKPAEPEIVDDSEVTYFEPEQKVQCQECQGTSLKSLTLPTGTTLTVCQTCGKRQATKHE